MSMRVRCPVCGMQVKLNRIYSRPVVTVEVGSKGRGRIFHKVVPTPSFILKRVKDVLKTASEYIGLYNFDKEALPFLVQKLDLSLEPNSAYQPVLIERRC